MKKLVIFALVLAMITVPFLGCNKTPAHFKGEWHFSKISKIEISSTANEDVINDLKQQYGAEDEQGIIENALAAFTADKTFEPCYLKFDKTYTYTYDPAMEREATWVFYKTGENVGFISFYSELDAADGNPDPASNPDIVYNPETGTMLMTIKYIAFMVTIELSK